MGITGDPSLLPQYLTHLLRVLAAAVVTPQPFKVVPRHGAFTHDPVMPAQLEQAAEINRIQQQGLVKV